MPTRAKVELGDSVLATLEPTTSRDIVISTRFAHRLDVSDDERSARWRMVSISVRVSNAEDVLELM